MASWVHLVVVHTYLIACGFVSGAARVPQPPAASVPRGMAYFCCALLFLVSHGPLAPPHLGFQGFIVSHNKG